MCDIICQLILVGNILFFREKARMMYCLMGGGYFFDQLLHINYIYDLNVILKTFCNDLNKA